MFEKIKNSKLVKVVAGSLSACAIAAMGVIGACATGETPPTPSETLTTAVGTIQTDFMGYVAIVLPVALTIFGVVYGIRKAINFFKGASGGTRGA